VLDSIIDGRTKPAEPAATKEKKPVQKEETVMKPALGTVLVLQTYFRYDFVPGEKVIFLKIFHKIILVIFLPFGIPMSLQKLLQLIYTPTVG